MKKYFVWAVLCMAMCVGVCSCGGGDDDIIPDEKVVSSADDMYGTWIAEEGVNGGRMWYVKFVIRLETLTSGDVAMHPTVYDKYEGYKNEDGSWQWTRKSDCGEMRLRYIDEGRIIMYDGQELPFKWLNTAHTSFSITYPDVRGMWVFDKVTE